MTDREIAPAALPIEEDAGDIGAPGGIVSRALALRRHLTRRSPAQQRAVLAVAGACFVVAAVVAVRNLPDGELDPAWVGLVTVGVLGPLVTVALNGAEFQVQGLLLGQVVGFARAVRISVIGTAANLLPIPGSALVRTQALATTGEGYLRATSSTLLVALVWLGAVAGLAALLYGVASSAWLAAVGLGVIAAALCGTGYVLVRRLAPRHGTPRVFSMLLAVELATAAVGAARFYLMIRYLGLDATAGQAIALTLAGVVASATGIFPAGIGIREALAGAISPLVGLSASVGVVAAAVDRVAGLAVLAVLTLVLVLTGGATISTQESTA